MGPVERTARLGVCQYADLPSGPAASLVIRPPPIYQHLFRNNNNWSWMQEEEWRERRCHWCANSVPFSMPLSECQDGWDTDDGQFDNDVLLYAPHRPKT
jgi:hypothetical protein